ncbi:MAG: ChaN family lipoprotein [Polyangiaceae bacterium]
MLRCSAFVSLSLSCLIFACAPARAPSQPSTAATTSRPEPEPEAPSVPDDVVALAAGKVSVVRLSDGQELSSSQLPRELLKYDVLCAGEEHSSAAQHYAELWLVERLATHAPNLGLELGAGFEMWAVKHQGVLSAYGAGKVSEKRLLKQTQYSKQWGYPFAYYRPVLNRARELSLPLVALNAPAALTSRVAKGGLDGLDPWTSQGLPELDLNDADHRADFERRMKEHPGVEASTLDNYYAAQVLWDETMADNGMRWLDKHAPVRRLLIVAGQAHCQRSAIPKRIVRRGANGAAALLLTTQKPAADAATRYDYAVVVDSNSPD